MLHNYGCERPNFSSGLLQMFLHANGVFIAKEKTQGGQETLLEKRTLDWMKVCHNTLSFVILFSLFTAYDHFFMNKSHEKSYCSCCCRLLVISELRHNK